ncbi:MAG: 1-deoxy-D-xylulose-5-phosphate synthase [Desulfobacterota bacterium]|nr:1-deoxy-D-xylulose-5-phosphate synthase [Thermodesulfobacteriota bacterium]
MGTLLETIASPEDVRHLSVKDLPVLAQEIRDLIIDTVSRTGGHLAASLGVVELTIALHYVFDTPRDKIIWDVGHQTYAHKIITGRRQAFHTLRQFGGLSGFPKREESSYDCFNTGHSSTSISAALGMARSRALLHEQYNVIAVIGDGSLTAGMAFEALNHAGHIKEDIIVILNDNEMSISPNVGALSSYLSRLISGQIYNRFREELKTFLKNMPLVGPSAYRFARHSEDFFKSLFVPGLLFDELGFKYIGPVLGHKIELLIDDLHNIKNLRGPVLLHVVTKKGKGYEPAERNPVLFHGVGPFDKATGTPRKNADIPSYTDVFGSTLTRIAAMDQRVVAITAGMTSGTGLDRFAQMFPERFFDVGIAEQHAITFAAGMAASGLRPVAAIYSTFLQRSYDQVLHDVCLQNLPVVLVLDRAGIVGEDGATHHGLFDIAYLRSIPNLIFMAPKDENELQHMLYTAVQLGRPVAIRYPRGTGIGVPLDPEFTMIPVGLAEVLRHGTDAALVAIGNTVMPALGAADILAETGITCTVINSRYIKPLDTHTLCSYAHRVKVIVTVEENVLHGGFGSAVLEALAASGPLPPVVRLGIPDVFVEHGSQTLLRSRYGIDAHGIAAAVQNFFSAQHAAHGAQASGASR